MEKGKLKAYIVTSQWNENGDLIIWAESSGKAKASAINSWEFHGNDYTDLRAKRIKDFDKYADSKKVPIEELLKLGWCFYCGGLCGAEITQDNVDAKEAFVARRREDFNDFVDGDVYCDRCKAKLEECGKW